ncbi:MAG: DUF2269 family protein, partial [Nocardiopsaceae bacterium]|nr:DUF2269 family protein [Nocardiopsaceae bacterium]
MSFTDNLLLWLHIAIAVFAIGPLTIATMSTPRYVRRRDLPVLRYLARITRIYAVIALAVLIVGGVLAQLRDDLGKPWLIVSMTLFVVALVLLLLVIRDQRGAIAAIEAATASPAAGPAGADAGTGTTAESASADAAEPAGTGTGTGTAGTAAGSGTAA